MQFLNQTDYNAFTHHYSDNQPIVNKWSVVFSLINTKLKGLPDNAARLLARPSVTGKPGAEQILWGTDAFTSKARRLSDLPADERSRYEEILDREMQQLGQAVAKADDETRAVLTEAVTVHDPSAVYCADDQVVITEWGMHPKNVTQVSRLPLGIKQEQEKKEEKKQENKEEKKQENKEDLSEDSESSRNSRNSRNSENFRLPPPPRRPAANPAPKPADRPWLKWLLMILGALLLLWLLSFLLRDCSCSRDNSREIIALPPDINPDEDIIASPDSMTRIVSNRLIVVITSGGTVNEFVDEFRKKYPDHRRYQFANPDTLIPRMVLLLPAEERETMIERLPAEFPDWELVVIPETLFSSSDTPTDPAFSDPRKRWYFDMTEVYDAWDLTRGDKNVKIAIIDDGFDLNHPEIKGKVVDTYNAVYHNREIFNQAESHGLHVASTAAGIADNGEGASGIAPGCDLILIQVGDRNGLMPMSAVLDGVLYAIKSGAKVVNMSLGMEFDPDLQHAPVELQEEIIRNRFLEEEAMWKKIFEMGEREGVTFVIATGNQNLIAGLDPMQRSDRTILVSAVQPDKVKAPFSNYGSRSTLSAPGVGIYNAVGGGKYEFYDGTSMASPIVAGGVALLKSIDPSLTTGQITAILQKTGIPSPSDVGPIVNFGRAARLLKEKGPEAGTTPATDCPPGTDCDEIRSRYEQLLQEIEQIRRDHPGCIESPDTLEIPEGATVEDLRGVWKSTTSIRNSDDEEVVLYFTFDGSPAGRLQLVEPSGKRFTGPLQVSIDTDKVTLHQTDYCASADGEKYLPYDFILIPDRNRVAQGTAISQTEKFRQIRFNLIRIR